MMKRFTNYNDTILDNEGGQLIQTDEIVDKLNELSDENVKFRFMFDTDPSRADSYKKVSMLVEHDTRETIIRIINKRILEYQQKDFLSNINDDSITSINNVFYDNAIKVIELKNLKKEIKKYVW